MHFYLKFEEKLVNKVDLLWHADIATCWTSAADINYNMKNLKPWLRYCWIQNCSIDTISILSTWSKTWPWLISSGPWIDTSKHVKLLYWSPYLWLTEDCPPQEHISGFSSLCHKCNWFLLHRGNTVFGSFLLLSSTIEKLLFKNCCCALVVLRILHVQFQVNVMWRFWPKWVSEIFIIFSSFSCLISVCLPPQSLLT